MLVRLTIATRDVPEVGPTYPAGSVVCRVTLTSDCITTASARAGFPVAYLPGSERRAFVLLAVVEDARQPRGQRAVAEMREGDAFVTVFSAPRHQPAGVRVGEVSAAPGTGAVRVSGADGAAQATVDWVRNSDAYRVEVYWPGGSSSEAERLVQTAFREVHFAS